MYKSIRLIFSFWNFLLFESYSGGGSHYLVVIYTVYTAASSGQNQRGCLLKQARHNWQGQRHRRLHRRYLPVTAQRQPGHGWQSRPHSDIHVSNVYSVYCIGSFTRYARNVHCMYMYKLYIIYYIYVCVQESCFLMKKVLEWYLISIIVRCREERERERETEC